MALLSLIFDGLFESVFLTANLKYKIWKMKVVTVIEFVIIKYLQIMIIQFVDCLLSSTHLSFLFRSEKENNVVECTNST